MCHEIAEQGEMAVIDIRSVELDDTPQFSHDSGTSCFDAKDIEYFDATV